MYESVLVSSCFHKKRITIKYKTARMAPWMAARFSVGGRRAGRAAVGLALLPRVFNGTTLEPLFRAAVPARAPLEALGNACRAALRVSFLDMILRCTAVLAPHTLLSAMAWTMSPRVTIPTSLPSSTTGSRLTL
jgi:hypothetical protein